MDLDQNFRLDVDTHPDLDWHKHDADSHTDLPPSFTHVGNLEIFCTFSQSTACLQCFIFLLSVKGIIIFSILDSIMKISGKKWL